MTDMKRFVTFPWEEDEVDEPDTGACWNCGRTVEVEVEGNTYVLCLGEIASKGEMGSADVIDPEIRDCDDWVNL